MLLTNYPEDWRKRYRQRKYEIEDPVVLEGRHNWLPFIWGDQLYLERVAPTTQHLVSEARDFGIFAGMTIPIHGPRGECALFSVAGPQGWIHDRLSASHRALFVIAQYLRGSVIRSMPRIALSGTVKLSEHERICLVWTTQGKTAWEIAQITGRSKTTVEFHLRRATLKLEATSKIHAICRALQMDLL